MVMTGTRDTKTTGRFFPKGPRSMRQGATRHERAHNYVRAGHAAAEALGTRCAWTVINVPDVGHDGERMSIAAAPVVAAALRASKPTRRRLSRRWVCPPTHPSCQRTSLTRRMG